MIHAVRTFHEGLHLDPEPDAGAVAGGGDGGEALALGDGQLPDLVVRLGDQVLELAHIVHLENHFNKIAMQ